MFLVILAAVTEVPHTAGKTQQSRQMAGDTERPIIFVLSKPADEIEAFPANLIAWTNGRALVATGRISDGMFATAANAVSSLVTLRQPGSSLFPILTIFARCPGWWRGLLAKLRIPKVWRESGYAI